jgi:hypothetical protein
MMKQTLKAQRSTLNVQFGIASEFDVEHWTLNVGVFCSD